VRIRLRTLALLCLPLGLAPALAAPPAAAGDLYRYVDARGIVHFTNSPTDRRFQPVRPVRERLQVTARHRDAFDGVIASAARQHGVPPALVKAVIAAESAFQPRALSRKGAMGLMQLMPETAAYLGVREPFRPEANVYGGTAYLRELHDRFGDWTHTLAAYNAGPTAVERYRGVPPYAETRQYVKRVFSYYRRFHGHFGR
jgi:soluble lytic murein transglycosylase